LHTGTPGTPVILENLDRTGGTHERLDFGGGPLGSPGGNCIYGGGALEIEDTRDNLSARRDWWGQPGGPTPNQIAEAGGSVDSSQALAQPPVGTC